MLTLKELCSMSKIRVSLIVAFIALITSVVLVSIDLWSILRLNSKLDNYTDAHFVYYLEEKLTQTPLKRNALELIFSTFIFLIILHMGGVFLNSYLIYIILKRKHRLLIIWILGNGSRVFLICTMKMCLYAHFMTQDTKKYQVYRWVVAVVGITYFVFQLWIIDRMIKLYLYFKSENSRFRTRKTDTREIIDLKASTVFYGTTNEAMECENVPAVRLQESQTKI